jgi:hypothetical protein
MPYPDNVLGRPVTPDHDTELADPAVVAVAALPEHDPAVVAVAALPEHDPAVVAVAALPEHDPAVATV